MSQFQVKSESSRLQRARVRRNMWFLRGLLVAAVTHSVLAAADFTVEVDSVWSELDESVALHATQNNEAPKRLLEIELQDNTIIRQLGAVEAGGEESSTPKIASAVVVLNGLKFPVNAQSAQIKLSDFVAVAEKPKDDVAEQSVAANSKAPPSKQSGIYFPDDVPTSEILRVSRTFHGMVQETLRQEPKLLSGQFLGSLADSDPMTGEKLVELETTFLDESSTDDGYALGQEVDAELASLDPGKTYTVVNGRIHAVTPAPVAQTERARFSDTFDVSARSNSVQAASPADGNIAEQARSTNASSVARSEASASSNPVALELPQDAISKGISQVLAHPSSAALDTSSAAAERVTLQGRVSVPEGFARNRVVLRMAGTPFQVQTDSSGAFELRDVPRGTRFELLVWHLDGSLTRRLIPVTASGRERAIEVALQRVSDIDALAGSFGLQQHLNQGGFCGRVEAQNPAALLGGRILVKAGGRILRPHFFSESGLPSTEQSELSSDGRFCVFNVEESLIDVKVTLLNGTRRQFVVHVEPSTFEHDLVFDVVESIYRKVSLLEPLDAQQVFELSRLSIEPDFGDGRLRHWLQGTDVPIWTRVGRFLLQSDPAYAVVRPNAEDVQFFPGGQEFVELRLAPHVPGSPWSRVVLSRYDLLSDSILKQFEVMKGQIYQDRENLISVAALDADAWDELAAQNIDISRLDVDSTGGLYVSIDPSGLNARAEDMVVSVRDAWSGKEVCQVVPLRRPNQIKDTRFVRAACSAKPGQYVLILETKEGALLWSDVVRIRPGDVQTVTVLDPKF